MASLAELMFQEASKSVSSKADVAGAFAQGAAIAQKKQQLDINMQQVEQQKEFAELKKVNLLTNTIKDGMTKVPQKARRAFFTNFVSKQAEQLGLPFDKTFVDALMSDDVDQTSLLNDLIEYDESLRTGDLDQAKGFAPSALQAFSGDVTALAKYTSSVRNAEAQASARGITERRQREQFAAQEERKTTVNFQGRKQNLAKEVIKLGIPGLTNTIDKIDKEIPGGLDGFNPDVSNIPGVGETEAAIPIGRLGKKGRRMRQLAMGLGNQVLKLRSGAQINEQEATRILGELGIDQAIGEGGGVSLIFKGTKSDEDFVNGVKDAKEALAKTQGVLRQGFGDDAFSAVMSDSAGSAPPKRVKTLDTPRGESPIGQELVDKLAPAFASPEAKAMSVEQIFGILRANPQLQGASDDQINALIKKFKVENR